MSTLFNSIAFWSHGVLCSLALHVVSISTVVIVVSCVAGVYLSITKFNKDESIDDAICSGAMGGLGAAVLFMLFGALILLLLAIVSPAFLILGAGLLVAHIIRPKQKASVQDYDHYDIALSKLSEQMDSNISALDDLLS